MVRYSDELLDEIRSKNDIVDIISQYVILKRSGRNFFGLCPFHKEKSPSFSVSADKQIFHCFGCGVGGNVFHFMSKIENIGFIESVGMLANRAGIGLPTLNNNEDEKTAKLKTRIYELNEATAEFYHQNVYQKSSKTAQEYIKSRKLDNNTLKSFKIGYSGKFDELHRHLKSLGFTEEEILISGLVNKNDNGKFIDRYRNRLMFPILDTRNRVIAFGGRVLDNSKPKYINSPENIVYSKGRHLFGLNVAKKQGGQLDRILVVEGYMDAISLYQRGITNVVASLGTALTEAQGRLLRRHTMQVVLGYDADGAGQTAILRGLDILKDLGVDVRVLQMQGAKDPDEYVIKYGPERLLKCIDQSISLVEYKVKMFQKGLDLNQPNDKIKFLNLCAKTLSEIDNSIEREIYVGRISEVYQISKEAIYAEINKLLYKNNMGSKVLEKKPIAPIQKKENTEETKIDELTKRREQMLIYFLINYTKESYKSLKDTISLEDIQIEKNKNIIQILFEKLEEEANIESVLDWFEDQETVSYISGIIATDFEIVEVKKALTDIQNAYIKEKMLRKRNQVMEELGNSRDMDKTHKEALEKELNNIIIKLASIK